MAAMEKAGAARRSARFPTVAGRSLLGVEMTLPGDFPADLTLAMVAFRQWQQDLV